RIFGRGYPDMSENPLVSDIAKFLSAAIGVRDGGYTADDAETDAIELLRLLHKSAADMMGLPADAHAWEPLCGSNVVGVTITKDGELHPGSSDPERWMMIMFDAEESGHMARSVSLNKRISQYLRSTLAMIEDELPE